MNPDQRATWWLRVTVVLQAIVLVIGAIYVAGLLNSDRAKNERISDNEQRIGELEDQVRSLGGDPDAPTVIVTVAPGQPGPSGAPGRDAPTTPRATSARPTASRSPRPGPTPSRTPSPSQTPSPSPSPVVCLPVLGCPR